MTYWKDLVERAVATYLEVAIGLWIASAAFDTGVVDLTAAKIAAVSAIPAGLSVIKSGLASLRGNRDSASLARDI